VRIFSLERVKRERRGDDDLGRCVLDIARARDRRGLGDFVPRRARSARRYARQKLYSEIEVAMAGDVARLIQSIYSAVLDDAQIDAMFAEIMATVGASSGWVNDFTAAGVTPAMGSVNFNPELEIPRSLLSQGPLGDRRG
jgi:hypothetical protein